MLLTILVGCMITDKFQGSNNMSAYKGVNEFDVDDLTRLELHQQYYSNNQMGDIIITN